MGIQQHIKRMATGIDIRLSAFAVAFGAAAAGLAYADMAADVAYITKGYGEGANYLEVYSELAERGIESVGAAMVPALATSLSALFCVFSVTAGLVNAYVDDITKPVQTRMSKAFALAATAAGVFGMVCPISLYIPLNVLPGADQYAMPWAAAAPGFMLMASVALNGASEMFRSGDKGIKPQI